MRRCTPLLVTLLTASAALAVLPGVAPAANRFAAVGGSGTACTAAVPCAVTEAVNNASAGDDIAIAPGTYALGSGNLAVARNNLTIHGPTDGPKPSITSTAGNVIYMLGDGNLLRDVSVTHTGTGVTGVGLIGASTAERIEVQSSVVGGTACGIFYTAVIRDSTCVSSGTSGVALGNQTMGIESTAVARNVTAIATGANSAGVSVSTTGSSGVSIDARNVIARGSDDVSAYAFSSGPASVTLNNSDFLSTYATAGGTVTAVGAGSNITAAPLFVNGPAGDYRQLAGSPTINAGTTDSRTGTTDFEGDARPQGSAIDIGADEFREVAAPPVDTTPPDTTIDRAPRKKTKSKRATFSFNSNEAGSTFVCSVDGGSEGSCISPLRINRLRRGTHFFSVYAQDAAGNVDSRPATYRWKVRKKKR